MQASLSISGQDSGVSVVVDGEVGSVSNSPPASVAVLVGQRIEITLDSGGTEYDGVVTIEIEME